MIHTLYSYDDDFDDHYATVDFNEAVDADVLKSRRRLRSEEKSKAKGSAETIPNTLVQKVTLSGVAVKSAITRFFKRGAHESDPYIVDIEIFNEGRPRLELGVDGIIILVTNERFSTTIAYSTSSKEYAHNLRNFKSGAKAYKSQGDFFWMATFWSSELDGPCH